MAEPDEATIVHYVRWEERSRFVDDLCAQTGRHPHPDHPGMFPSVFRITSVRPQDVTYPMPHPDDFSPWFHQPLHAKVEVVYRRPIRKPSP
jgi:hypothetical protein